MSGIPKREGAKIFFKFFFLQSINFFDLNETTSKPNLLELTSKQTCSYIKTLQIWQNPQALPILRVKKLTLTGMKYLNFLDYFSDSLHRSLTILTIWAWSLNSYEEYTAMVFLLPALFPSNMFPGFERPSAIQQRAIMPVLKDRDVIAQAQSGTGKTATFSISVLQKIDNTVKQCQALILAPTRELAQQIQKVVIALGDFLNIEVCLPRNYLLTSVSCLYWRYHRPWGYQNPSRRCSCRCRNSRTCIGYDSKSSCSPHRPHQNVCPRRGRRNAFRTSLSLKQV